MWTEKHDVILIEEAGRIDNFTATNVWGKLSKRVLRYKDFKPFSKGLGSTISCKARFRELLDTYENGGVDWKLHDDIHFLVTKYGTKNNLTQAEVVAQILKISEKAAAKTQKPRNPSKTSIRCKDFASKIENLAISGDKKVNYFLIFLY